MLRTFGIAALVSSVGLAAVPAHAFDAVVTSIDKNKDGSATYHFAIRTGSDETLGIGEGKATGDFVTVYNFYGLVDGSAKAPAGWEVSSEEFGRTPTANGYPLVLPLDVPNTPNLTWTVTKPVAPGTQVAGFSATTRVATSVRGQFTAQVTHRLPSAPAGVSADAAPAASKQAIIGGLPTPTFLADVK